jgi:hypothetical protein
MSQNQLNSALLHIVQTDHIDMTKTLILRGADVNYIFDNKCPMWHAITNNKPAQVKVLIENKANLNSLIDNQSLLFYAVNNKYNEIVKILLDAGCDCNERNTDGENILYRACVTDNEEVAELLLLHYRTHIDFLNIHGNSILCHVCSSIRGLRFVEMLLKAGANPNIQDKDGNTPLMHACKSNNNLRVELLLKEPNINIDLKNNSGQTAIQLVPFRSPSEKLFAGYKKPISLNDVSLKKHFNKAGKEFPTLIPKKPLFNIEVICDEIPNPIILTIPENTALFYLKWDSVKEKWLDANFVDSNKITIEVVNEKMTYHFSEGSYIKFKQLTMPDGKVRNYNDLYHE